MSNQYCCTPTIYYIYCILSAMTHMFKGTHMHMFTFGQNVRGPYEPREWAEGAWEFSTWLPNTSRYPGKVTELIAFISAIRKVLQSPAAIIKDPSQPTREARIILRPRNKPYLPPASAVPPIIHRICGFDCTISAKVRSSPSGKFLFTRWEGGITRAGAFKSLQQVQKGDVSFIRVIQ